MRPQQLTLEGLRSYREPVTIDFDRLAEAGLFGIVGPTGAGKSTIIDAIFLALYGDVPRNNSAIEFIHPDAPAATVELTFAMSRGGEWTTYRIRREWRRVKKRGSAELSEEISTPRVALWKQNASGEELLADGAREVNELIEDEVIGIPMTDFRRSIVLPQGEFDRLLRAMPKERAQLLGRVFGLSRFGAPLQRKVIENRQALDQQMQALRAKLGVRESLLLQADQTRADATSAAVALEVARGQFAEAEAKAQRLTQGHTLSLAWTRAQQDLASTEQAAANAEQWRVVLERANRATQATPAIEAFESASRRASELRDRLATKQRELSKLESEEARLRIARDTAVSKLQENEPAWLQQIDHARRATTALAEATELEAKVKQSQAVLEKARKDLAELDAKKGKLEARRTELTQQIASLEHSLAEQRVQPADRERAAALLAWAEATEALARAKASRSEHGTALQQATAALEAARQNPALQRDVAASERLASERRKASEAARTLHLQLGEAEIAETAIAERETEVSRRCDDLKSTIAALEPSLSKALEDVANAADAQTSAEQAWAGALRLAQAAHLAESLVDGSPCPVCGSEAHPSPARMSADVKAAEKTAKAVAKILKLAQDEAARHDQAIAKARVQLEQTEELLTERRGERFAAMTRIEKLRERGEKLREIPWAANANRREAALEALLSEAEVLEQRAREEKRAFEIAQHELQDASSAREIVAARHTTAVEAARVAELATERTALADVTCPNVDEAKQRSLSLTQRDQQCALWEAALHARRDALAPVEAELRSFDGSRASIGQQFERQRAQAELEAAQLADRRRELESLAGGRNPATWLKSLEAQLSETRAAAVTAKDAWNQTHGAAESTRTVVAEVTQQSTQASAEKSRAEGTLALALEQSAFASIDEAKSARMPAMEREQLHAKVQHVLAEHAAARATAERVAREVQAYDAPLPTEVEVAEALTAQKDARQRFEQCFAESSRLSEQIRQIEIAEAESSELQTQVKALGPKSARAELLEKLLRGDALVAHAADRHLARILASATANLKHLSTDRYELLQGEDGSFAVKDRYQTGALRPASTLSGGESFLVSLALALALSDHIQQQGHVRFDFFFLDEGFGSLDDETLHVAIDALERLRGQQRTIGTISHLPALLDRLPRKLVVQKAPVGGTATIRVEG
jgi:exonuclease SbcC